MLETGALELGTFTNGRLEGGAWLEELRDEDESGGEAE